MTNFLGFPVWAG